MFNESRLINYNKFYKVMFKVMLFSLVFVGGCLSTKCYAVTYNDPIAFYKEFGGGKVQYIDGRFYFAQKGEKATTGTKYQIEGFEIGASVGGRSYKFSTCVGGTYLKACPTKEQKESDGKTYKYDLWYIDYNVLVSRLKEVHKDVDFSELVNRSKGSIFTFDAYVSLINAGVTKGSVTNAGGTSPVLYHDVKQKPASWIPSTEWRELFTSKTVKAADKPAYPSLRVEPIAVGDYNSSIMHKVDAKTYYVKAGNYIHLSFRGIASFYNPYVRINELVMTMTNKAGDSKGDITGVLSTSGHNDKPGTVKLSSKSKLVLYDSYVSRVLAEQEKADLVAVVKSGTDNDYYTFYPSAHAKLNGTGDRIVSTALKPSDKRMTIIFDGVGPYCKDGTAKVTFNSELGDCDFEIYLQNVKDYAQSERSALSTASGSGLKSVKGTVTVGGKSKEVTFKQKTSGSTTYVYYGNFKDFGNVGKITGKVILTDNVGNTTEVKIKETEPSVTVVSSVIKGYEYQDPSTKIKWVKADNEFYVQQEVKTVGLSLEQIRCYFTAKNKTVSASTDTDVGFCSSVVDKNTKIMRTLAGSFYVSRNASSNIISRDYFTVSGTTNQTTNFNYYTKAQAELHGKIFKMHHEAKALSKKGTGKWSGLKEVSGEYLGIDAKGPEVTPTQTGTSKFSLSLKDNESGLQKLEITPKDGTTQTITLSGKSKTQTIDLGNAANAKIVAYDNVGNKTTKTVYATVVNTSIETKQITKTVNGKDRKYLEVTAKASAKHLVPNDVIQVRLTGTGDGLTYAKGYEADKVIANLVLVDEKEVKYTFLVDDTYNQSYGPSLSYSGTGVDGVVTVGSMSDLNKSYSFSLSTKYRDCETKWVNRKTVNPSFNSGYDHFEYSLYRMTDEKGNNLPTPTLVKGFTRIPSNKIYTKYLNDGTFKVVCLMKDFNGNPSGRSELLFTITGSDNKYGLNVTAVKDLNWEKAVYPFNYENDASKFPLGSAYMFNGKPIKVGYALNFNITTPSSFVLSNLKVNYDVYGKDNSGNKIALTLKSGGTLLSTLDSSSGTTYLKQTRDFIYKNRTVYLKHYLPANLEARTSNGKVYTGNIYVDVNLEGVQTSGGADTPSEDINTKFNLYAVTQDSSALDDIGIDKQR